MAEMLPPIIVEILAKTGGLEKDLERSEARMDKFAGSVDRSSAAAEVSTLKIGSGMDSSARKTEESGKRTETALGSIASNFQNLGGPMGRIGGHFDDLDKRTQGLSKESRLFGGVMESLPSPMLIAGGAVLGLAGYAVHLQMGMDKATASIAASAGISQSSAHTIGESFAATAGETTYNSTQLAESFGLVAGQLKSVEGKALGSGKALDFMRSASDLAEASHTSLDGATKALAGTLQVYKMKADESGHASDVLFKASTETGMSVEQLAKMLQMTKSRLGEYAGSVGETASFLVELTQEGYKGRQATSALGTAMTTLGKSAGAVKGAQEEQLKVTRLMTPEMKRNAEEFARGHLTSEEYKKTLSGLSPDQQLLGQAFEKTQKAVEKANEKFKQLHVTAFNSHGDFVGLKSVVAQLEPQFAKMSKEQQLQAATSLFGSGAAKQMVSVIDAGIPKYQKVRQETEKDKSAKEAAKKQNESLSAMMERVTSAFKDFITKGGGPVAGVLKTVLSGLLLFVEGLKTGNPIVIAITGAVMGLAVAVGILMIAALPITGTMMLIIAAIALVGAVIAFLVTHWTQAWDFIKKAVAMALGPILAPIKAMIDFIITHFKDIVTFFVGLWHEIESLFGNAWKTLEHIVSTAWTEMEHEVSAGVKAIVSFFSKLPSEVLAFLNSLPGKMFTVGRQIMSGLAEGFTSMLSAVLQPIKEIGEFLGLIEEHSKHTNAVVKAETASTKKAIQEAEEASTREGPGHSGRAQHPQTYRKSVFQGIEPESLVGPNAAIASRHHSRSNPIDVALHTLYLHSGKIVDEAFGNDFLEAKRLASKHKLKWWRERQIAGIIDHMHEVAERHVERRGEYVEEKEGLEASEIKKAKGEIYKVEHEHLSKRRAGDRASAASVNSEEHESRRGSELRIEQMIVHGADHHEVAHELYRKIRPHMRQA